MSPLDNAPDLPLVETAGPPLDFSADIGGLGPPGLMSPTAAAVDWKAVWLEEALYRLSQAHRVISEQRERIAYLESLSLTDELTGLINRRGFEQALRRELAEASRHANAQGVLVMIDVDEFKTINDVHGHLAGDRYLRRVAQILTENVRAMDLVARLGGDEFAILMPRVDEADGRQRAHKLIAFANGQSVPWECQALPVKLSQGTHVYTGAERPEEIILRADRKLYENKRQRHARQRVAQKSRSA